MVDCFNDQEIAFINQSLNCLVLKCVEVFFSDTLIFLTLVSFKLILIFSQVVLKYAYILY
jgi:hypothetical protein